MRLSAVALVAGLALLGCRRGGESVEISPLIGPQDPVETAERSTSGGGPLGEGVRIDGPQEYEVAPQTLAKVPYSGSWAPLAAAQVRAFSVSPALVTEEVQEWKGRGDLFPRTRNPSSPARAVGLLASIDWWRSAPPECRGAPPTERVEYNFSLDGSSYALYFPSDGRGFNFLPNWSVEVPHREGGAGSYRIDAAMFRADTPNPWGLKACAHLVELEVNHGRGGRGIHFIATALRIVEGTETFEGRAQEVLESLTRRFVASAEGHDDDLRQEYQRVAALWARHGPPQGLSQHRLEMGPVGLGATWIAEAGELEVVLFRSGKLSDSKVVGREVIQPSTCPPGAPCAYRESGTFDQVSTWTVTAEFAARYRVDRAARLVGETVYLPRVTFDQRSERRRVIGGKVRR